MTNIGIALLAVNCFVLGILVGALLMQTKITKFYGKEHDRITCGIIHRLYKSMLSLSYDKEEIDIVVERMGQKILPPSIPAPTHVLTPKEKRKKSDK